ncbi:MAG: phosphoglucosamine mutase [bacterium]|nr:phosphoglucosamine mutase [bacterium]
MSRYFGTDGFRGEANKDLTVEHAYKIGRFLGWYYKEENEKDASGTPRIVIGKDTRRSSYMFEYSLVSGITASGAEAYLAHVTPTPSISYITRTEGFDCGIMISASHNPYYDNGIKIMNSNGEKMEDRVIEKIEDYLDGKFEVPFAKRDEIGRTVDYVYGRDQYVEYLLSLATKSFEGYRIGLDCSNGSASSIAKTVFETLGAKTFVIHNEPNGTNINNNCGSTCIEVLQKFVLENQLDAGFAYDGDADRCIAVDELGNVINGDIILYIYGRYMKERGRLTNNTVVTTVMSNLGLYKAFDDIGIRYEQTTVGDKYVYENMVANGHRLGGEESGHIIFGQYGATGDGILTSLKLMQAMIGRGMPLSKLAEPVTIYPQIVKNIKVSSKRAVKEDHKVMEEAKKVEELLGNEGRIVVRESGTEPVIRVMVEAPEQKLCEEYASRVIQVIKSQGYEVS